MRLEEKQKLTEEISRRMDAAETIYLTDFTGLDVKDMTEFRSRLSEQGIDYVVVKNTLALRALDGLELPDVAEFFQGPTGLVLGAEDPVVPAKVIREFARDHDERPVVKIGIVDRRRVSAEEVSQLAELPSRDDLLAGIARGLTSGVAGIAGALEALMRDLAYMIEQVPGAGTDEES